MSEAKIQSLESRISNLEKFIRVIEKRVESNEKVTNQLTEDKEKQETALRSLGKIFQKAFEILK